MCWKVLKTKIVLYLHGILNLFALLDNYRSESILLGHLLIAFCAKVEEKKKTLWLNNQFLYYTLEKGDEHLVSGKSPYLFRYRTGQWIGSRIRW